MTTTHKCQRCSQLPPPPPIFSMGPPPKFLSMEIRCSSRMLLSASVAHEQVTPSSSSSSSSSVSVALGIMIALLITTGTVILIKNRMIKRRKGRQRQYDDSCSSIKFNGHHHDRHWRKFLPLLSDSCSSDQTLSTPSSEYPCGFIEPLLSNDIQHEYEQIRYNNSAHYYCLVYCRLCANYHHASSSCRQTNIIQSYYQQQCTCHLRNDGHLFELQPMLRTNIDDIKHQLPI
ncbi:unnamed protein product [Rotaria socialis]|uniref:Uncharacterized protein n=1 Tax=Rotaria socialis TaxID=392032 RepID=A0A818NU71_9BILA|nr:unnamed protein product [Rotaria socialis]CAF3641023.1 unnamed protein product [Rotaria socialis]CAF3642432.1 unnamed protein product [Rotaria socialis]CAF4272700.1 unnamed protein product [Rotaria socialis]CAF4481272.1 unnamed protein product [Rotaria socialis]